MPTKRSQAINIRVRILETSDNTGHHTHAIASTVRATFKMFDDDDDDDDDDDYDDDEFSPVYSVEIEDT